LILALCYLRRALICRQIYVYGGYPGSTKTSIDSVLDDVYILSIPSFTWIKAYTGKPLNGRRSHKCIKVLPDLMFIIGGQMQSDQVCVDGMVKVFNLNTLEFQDSYDPANYSSYQVPNLVASVIGGG
jgi:hypothetical protein